MSNVKDVTDGNFQSVVLGSKKVFVLDFFSEWCAPCKAMTPVFNGLAGEFGESVDFGKIDISVNPQTPGARGVMSVPTFAIFKGGEEVKRFSGITPKEKFKSEIEKFI